MPTKTLAEFIKIVPDDLLAGIIQDIYTLNPIYEFMPWDGYTGSGITANREATLGDVQVLPLGATITAKNPSTVDRITFSATTLLGDAEINGLQQVESEASVNDNTAIEISSKAKNIGRLIQALLTGKSADPNQALFFSMPSLIDSAQYVSNDTIGGEVLSFEMLDLLLAKIDSKDGQVDWIMMAQRDLINLKKLYRAMGGTAADYTVTLPDGRTTATYEGIPIFVNRWLSTTETDDGAALTGGVQSSVYAGVWDDGTRKIGAAMIHPAAAPAGIFVEPVGAMETKDESIWRVKCYCNFAIYNRRGIARLTGIKAG